MRVAVCTGKRLPLDMRQKLQVLGGGRFGSLLGQGRINAKCAVLSQLPRAAHLALAQAFEKRRREKYNKVRGRVASLGSQCNAHLQQLLCASIQDVTWPALLSHSAAAAAALCIHCCPAAHDDSASS